MIDGRYITGKTSSIQLLQLQNFIPGNQLVSYIISYLKLPPGWRSNRLRISRYEWQSSTSSIFWSIHFIISWFAAHHILASWSWRSIGDRAFAIHQEQIHQEQVYHLSVLEMEIHIYSFRSSGQGPHSWKFQCCLHLLSLQAFFVKSMTFHILLFIIRFWLFLWCCKDSGVNKSYCQMLIAISPIILVGTGHNLVPFLLSIHFLILLAVSYNCFQTVCFINRGRILL